MNDLYVTQLRIHTRTNKQAYKHTHTHKGGPLTLLFDFVCASLGLL